MKKNRNALSQEQLREIAWEIGKKYQDTSPMDDYVALTMVHPHLGHIHWRLQESSLAALKAEHEGRLEHAPLVARIYDITDVIFDGFNAHASFDINITGLSGSYYFAVDRLARDYLAEIGLRAGDGTFWALARSEVVLFERDRPSRNYQISGLFVGNIAERKFPIENIFDAPIYENMNRELTGLEKKEPLNVAMVFVGINLEASLDGPLGVFIENLSKKFNKFWGDIRFFAPTLKTSTEDERLLDELEPLSEMVFAKLRKAHREKAFHLIHCHDWYSLAAAAHAASALELPLIFSLHSTEHERSQGKIDHTLSAAICDREKEGVQQADLVIVPHSSTRQQLIEVYGADPDKVVIIPDVLSEKASASFFDPTAYKRQFSLNPDAPVVLFAGEISHIAGADLLMEAVPTVCANHATVQFVFAGEGPLKGELEAKAWHAGLGHRCKFFGDVSQDSFNALLMASDFVVIPARTWQDEGLAQMAIERGKSVLTTHQAGLSCVAHGENGLVAYDNPGSIVWGIQELLANPLHGSMMRSVARRKANQTPSLETVAAQHYTYYEIVLRKFHGEEADE